MDRWWMSLSDLAERRRALPYAAAVAVAVLALGPSPARAALPSGNLIQNSGAESGTCSSDGNTVEPIPSWTTSSVFTVTCYGSPGFPGTDVSSSIGGGGGFFAGGPGTSDETATQTVDVSGAANEIDAGGVQATLSGYLGGQATQNDSSIVTAVFLSGSSQSLGSPIYIGPVLASDRNNQTTLLSRSTSGAVPAGTRSIRVTVTAAFSAGTYNDGYADNLSLTLGGGGPPPSVATLTVGKTGSGSGTVTSSEGQINCGTTCSHAYDEGASVTLTASGTPGAGVFTGWAGGGCSGGGTCTVTMDSDKSVTATFAPVHTVQVLLGSIGTAGLPGTVTASPAGVARTDCAGLAHSGGWCWDFASGTQVTLTVAPARGYSFSGWGPANVCNGVGACTLTMNQDWTVNPYFAEGFSTLWVEKSGAGSGLVTGPVGLNCGVECSVEILLGRPATLTAAPDPGSAFAGWWGNVCTGTHAGLTCSLSPSQTNVVATYIFGATFSKAPVSVGGVVTIGGISGNAVFTCKLKTNCIGSFVLALPAGKLARAAGTRLRSAHATRQATVMARGRFRVKPHHHVTVRFGLTAAGRKLARTRPIKQLNETITTEAAQHRSLISTATVRVRR